MAQRQTFAGPAEITREIETEGGDVVGVRVELRNAGYTVELTLGETDEDEDLTFVIRDANGAEIATVAGYNTLT